MSSKSQILYDDRGITSKKIETKQDPSEIHFITVSDYHIGSYRERLDFIQFVHEYADYNGIDIIINCGDLSEGDYFSKLLYYENNEMLLKEKTRRHLLQKTKCMSYMEQLQYIEEVYPNSDITTYIISGNHDIGFYIGEQHDIVLDASQLIDNMVYLGYQEANLLINNARIKVVHGTTIDSITPYYELPYKNKPGYIICNNLKTTPDILCLGHTHRNDYYECFDTKVLQNSSMVIRKDGNPQIGFYHVTLYFDDNGYLEGQNIEYHDLLESDVKVYSHAMFRH